MSLPTNPLESPNSYTTYFVIAAFAKTDDAENTPLSLEDGPEGESIGGGKGIVVVNDYIKKETAPSRFLVKDFRFDFNWTGEHVNTTVSGGSLIITDTTSGEFLTFLKQNVLEILSTSLENITFSMQLFFITDKNDNEIISPNPLFFSISQIEHKLAGNMHFYDCDVIPLYNAKAHYTSYTRIYNTTITHKDGQLHEEIPESNPKGNSIKSRKEEDSEKEGKRKERIEKSKPMTNLKQAFEAFELELNENNKIHDKQYQIWQGIIRDDFTDKIKDIEQIKAEKLPIQYKVHVDEQYEPLIIDNRNLPFEQPEQRQNISGVRVIPTRYGENIQDTIDRIMGYSRQIGIQARGGTTGEGAKKDYKVGLTWRRLLDEIKYDIWIKNYFLPKNKVDGFNSGYAAESSKEPFTFFFKGAGNADQSEGSENFETNDSSENSNMVNRDDLITVNGTLQRSNSLLVIEDVIDTEAGRLSFGAERETISAEREPNTEFFKVGYSGNRANILNIKTLGVEYPRELADTIKTKYPIQNTQQSTIEITIRGNPNLLSDLFRSPKDVANGEEGNAVHYRLPEVLPIYAKIIIQHKPIEDNDTITDDAFYHKEWMHIYKIENIIKAGALFQKLTLLRTDILV